MAKSSRSLEYISGVFSAYMLHINDQHRSLMRQKFYRNFIYFISNIFRGRTIVALPYIWLILFFFIPFLIILKISFSSYAGTRPPYQPLVETFADGVIVVKIYLENYYLLWSEGLYTHAYLSSLKVALISTFLTLLIAYPIAYAMSKARKEWRLFLIMLVILPFWTSFLIRVYAWIGILKPEGLLNSLLLYLNIIDTPLQIYPGQTAIYIGIVYSYLPFMILPLYATLEKIDHNLIEAALDLGCRPLKVFWSLTLRLSVPGILAGCFLVFIPTLGEFVIPDLLGDSSVNMIGPLLWREFFFNKDWPLSAAIAVILLLILIIPIMLFQRIQQKQFS